MLFRKDRDDMEEIKKAMEEEPTDVKEPLHEVALPEARREISAPLFVKVEKYREVLTGVHEMKIFIAGIRQLFDILNELEAVRSDTIKIMRATLQRLEKSVVEIDTELLRPRGLVAEARGEEASHIESSLSELQSQLGALKRELQEMK